MIGIDALVGVLLHLAPAERDPSPSRSAASRIVSTAALAPARWRPFQRCVEQRESNGIPTVVNSSGHAGLYQFSRAWSHGLPYMVADRLRNHGLSRGAAAAIRRDLSATPIQRWSATLQRVAFAAAISVPGNDRHWALAGSSCEALR